MARVLAHDGALALLTFTGAAAAIDTTIAAWPWPSRIAALVLVARAAVVAATFPFAYWLEVVHAERRRRASPRRWVGAHLLDALVSTVVIGAGVMIFSACVRAFPGSWPVVTAVALAGLVGLIAGVQPVLLDPLFHRFAELPEGDLRRDVIALAARAGTRLRGVGVLVTGGGPRANAYVSGIGPTQRLVLFDTLVAFPRDEALAVVAHELEHHRRRHHLKLTSLRMAIVALTAAAISILLGSPGLLRAAHASDATDPRLVPLLLLLVSLVDRAGAVLVAVPWRRWEQDADRGALDLTGDPAALARVIRRIAVANLSDLIPTRAIYLLTFTHPTAVERIRAVQSWAPRLSEMRASYDRPAA